VQESGEGQLYFYLGNTSGEIHVIPRNGGTEHVLPNMPRVNYPTDWVLAAKGIYFVDCVAPQPTVNYYDFAAAKVRQITTLDRPCQQWGGLAISHDEKWLAYSQIDDRVGDIMLVENFR